MEYFRILYTKAEAEEILSRYTPEQRREFERLAEVFVEGLAPVKASGTLLEELTTSDKGHPDEPA